MYNFSLLLYCYSQGRRREPLNSSFSFFQGSQDSSQEIHSLSKGNYRSKIINMDTSPLYPTPGVGHQLIKQAQYLYYTKVYCLFASIQIVTFLYKAVILLSQCFISCKLFIDLYCTFSDSSSPFHPPSPILLTLSSHIQFYQSPSFSYMPQSIINMLYRKCVNRYFCHHDVIMMVEPFQNAWF